MTKQLIAENTRPDNLVLAVGTILFTVLSLSLGDALIKQVSGDFVLWQIFVVRSMLAMPVLFIVIACFTQEATILPRRLGWTTARSLMLVAMWVAYYISLPHLKLSVAAATYYTLPMFITLFAAAFAGEKVEKIGWLAVAIGFLGVLLILRPEAENFNYYALLPLLSAMLYALAMILTRTKCRDEHPFTLSLALNACFILVGGGAAALIGALSGPERVGFLLAPWAPMGAQEWLAMTMLSVSILIGSIGAAIAYQNGPSSVVGTFDFAYVGFAAVWGVILFGERPDMISLLGMAMIVTAGIISARQRS